MKRQRERECIYRSGLKLAGAFMSHNSVFLFFRILLKVPLQGLWVKDTKSSGHLYALGFVTVDKNGGRD